MALGVINIGFNVAKQGLTKGLASAGKSLSGFGKMALAGAGVGAAFAAGSKLFAESIDVINNAVGQMDVLDKLAKMSDTLGISVDELRGLQYAADLSGTSMETLEKGLGKVARGIGEMQTGVGKGLGGIEQLGLKAEEIAGMGTYEAFMTLAEGISALPTAEARAAVATDVFGKAAQEMIPFLNEGAGGIKELSDQYLKMTGSMSRVDLAQVEAANDAITTAKAALTGIYQQVAIKISPVITALVEKFTSMATEGTNAGSIVSTGFKWVAKVIGIVADVIDVLHDAFLFLKAGVTLGIGFMVKGWSYVGQAIQAVVNLLPGVEVQFADTLTAIGDDLIKLGTEQGKEAMDAFIAPTPSEKLNRWLGDVEQRAAEAAKNIGQKNPMKAYMEANKPALDMLDKWQEELDTLGMSARDTEIWKLDKDKVDPALIERLQQINKELTSQEIATKALESIESPWEKYMKQVEEYRTAMAAGKLTEQQFMQASMKAAEGLDFMGPQETKLAGLATQGSAEARSIDIAQRFGATKSQEAVLLEKQLAETIVQTRTLNLIAQGKQPRQSGMENYNEQNYPSLN